MADIGARRRTGFVFRPFSIETSELNMIRFTTMTRAVLVLAMTPGLALAGCSVGERSDLTLAQAMPSQAASVPAKDNASTSATTSFDSESFYKLMLAEFAARRGQMDLALKNYLEVARSTGDPEVAERAVRIAVYARDQELGLEAAKLWADTASPNHSARQVYGVLLARAGRLDEAKQVLKSLADERAKVDSEIYNSIANMLAREKSRSASVEVMEAVVAGVEQSFAAQLALAQLLSRFGEFDKALVAIDKARAIEPKNERAVVFKAQVLQRKNAKPQAIEELATFLADNPSANDARLTYARLLVDGKRYADARNEFQTLSEAAPNNPDIAYALGLLLLQTNDLEPAEVQFRKLTADADRRDTAWFYLGQIAENRGDLDQALRAYRRVERGDHHLNSQIRAAIIMAENGDVAGARAHLHAQRGDNQVESVRLYRAEAELLGDRDQVDEALAVYDKGITEFPTDSGLLYARAMMAVRADRIDEVERDLRSILEREPDNADALNALGYTLADRTERYQEAYELIKRAHQLKPDDHYVVDSLGWVLYRLGRLDEAVKFLRRALELKADPEVAAHLGEVLWVMGDQAAAKDVWQTALEAEPEDKRLLDVLKRFGL